MVRLGVIFTRLKSDWNPTTKKGGLLVVTAAAVILLINVINQQQIPLSNFYSTPLHTATPNDTSTQIDSNSGRLRAVTQSFCKGRYCEKTANHDEISGDVASSEATEDDEVPLLPTSQAAKKQHLYQKDSILDIKWTEEKRAAWALVLKERHARLRRECHRANLTGSALKRQAMMRRNLVWFTRKRLVWCPIFKAASTTWVKNLLMVTGMKKVLKSGLHKTLRESNPQPATALEIQNTLNTSMRMIVVRHPFERLLSAYRDKMLRVASRSDPFIWQQQKIAHLQTDARHQPVPYSKEDVNKVYGNRRPTKLLHPTFTQFLKQAREDITNMGIDPRSMCNLHWRPFWMTCDPCYFDYDTIGHVETLDEDQEYVIHELGYQDLLRPVHSHSSRFDSHNNTSEAAKSYFGQVPLELLESLATLLRPDFELFGYSPDEYFALAGPRSS